VTTQITAAEETNRRLTNTNSINPLRMLGRASARDHSKIPGIRKLSALQLLQSFILCPKFFDAKTFASFKRNRAVLISDTF